MESIIYFSHAPQQIIYLTLFELNIIYFKNTPAPPPWESNGGPLMLQNFDSKEAPKIWKTAIYMCARRDTSVIHLDLFMFLQLCTNNSQMQF